MYVVGVHNEFWTVDLVGEAGDERVHYDVPIGGMVNPDGSGVHFMPAVGARAIIGVPDENRATPIIIGFAVGQSEATTDPNDRINAAGNRPILNSGEVCIKSSGGSGTRWYSSGGMESYSRSLARQVWDGQGNEFSMAHDKTFMGMGGSLDIGYDREGEPPMVKPATATLKGKEINTDASEVASLSLGGTGRNNPAGAYLATYASGSGTIPKRTPILPVTGTGKTGGEAVYSMLGDLTNLQAFTLDGIAVLGSLAGLALVTKGLAYIKSDMMLEVLTPQILLGCVQGIRITGDATQKNITCLNITAADIKSSSLSAGSGSLTAASNEDLQIVIDWCNSHTHASDGDPPDLPVLGRVKGITTIKGS